MVKRITLLGLFLISMLMIHQVSKAQSTLIHYWHFNTTLPSDGSGGLVFGPHLIHADYSITQPPAALIYKRIDETSSDSGSMDNCKGGSKNERMGYGGCCDTIINNGVRTRNPSDNMQFLWYIPTGNYKNIVITYETKASSFTSGQHEQFFSYSIDSGLNFITTGLPMFSYTLDTSYKKVALDLSSIESVNNNNKLVFRILYGTPNAITKGNNRFDNITVEGDSIFPTEIRKIPYSDFTLYPNPADNFLFINSSDNNYTRISVFSIEGQVLIQKSLVNNVIDISNLSKGVYIIRLENSGGMIISKFVKQ